ncbi:MAG: class I SAM-dependent methyltransferase [Nitrospirae bacterium]|nr:class I SAM-dependent methyltransferase [Magnetococcales bacterium]
MTNKINFATLTYEKFRELAVTSGLSHHEKVGFPNEYREGKEGEIFADMLLKVGSLNRERLVALEIGPGCSQLPVMLANLCASKLGTVHFVDSQEMLQQLPDAPHIQKWPGRYPETPGLFEKLIGKVDSIIAYSVIQYVFAEANLWDFIDRCLVLLNDGGEIFLGDIPNVTMRKRFFSGNEGVQLHKQFTGRDEMPDVQFNQLEAGRIDDSVVLSILARVRAEGYHAWVIPQRTTLPMANRREDILIRKP